MSDDWVYVGSYKYHTQYYSKSSVTIDEQKNTINVLVKIVTERKRFNYLKNIYSIKEPNYINFNQQFKWYVLDYKKWKFTVTRITDYSKSGNVLLDTKCSPEWLHTIIPVKWDTIVPDSTLDCFLNKLLQDHYITNDFHMEIGNNNHYNSPNKPSTVMTILNLLHNSITKTLNYNFFKF